MEARRGIGFSISRYGFPACANRKMQYIPRKGHDHVNVVDTNVLGSPLRAMEYLSRSWSPASSNFLQRFPLNDAGGIFDEHEEVLGGDCRVDDHEGSSETEETRCSTVIPLRLDSGELDGAITAEIAKGNAAGVVTWHNSKHIKGWLRGRRLTSLLRWNKEKRKEELRLHTAEMDAALSVARLAAAVAAITGTNIIGLDNLQSNNEMIPSGNHAENVVSFAAALVATVCAEAAERTGVSREHVSSAINSGFAAQTPADIVTLTATAATCLRGAATLRSRTIVDDYSQEPMELIASAPTIHVITASGNKKQRLVSIGIRNRQLLLSLTKKYFGVVVTHREYRILGIMEESYKSDGYHMIGLQTDAGVVQLLFQTEKQSQIWMSIISNSLQKPNVAWAKY